MGMVDNVYEPKMYGVTMTETIQNLCGHECGYCIFHEAEQKECAAEIARAEAVFARELAGKIPIVPEQPDGMLCRGCAGSMGNKCYHARAVRKSRKAHEISSLAKEIRSLADNAKELLMSDTAHQLFVKSSNCSYHQRLN
jgi:hypothetical protein